jgi:hypothetical protein
MSKTRRKAPTPKPENTRRGNIKPLRIITIDLIADWLYEGDMQHAIRYVPCDEWTDEEWRFYWKKLDEEVVIGGRRPLPLP